MTTNPMVRLENVLTLSNNAVSSASLNEINLAGVYSFGRGLFKRGPLSPMETTYKSYNRLVTDEFVISQPKAWEGAIARVTKEFDGWYLSPVFPTFRLDKERVDPRYLEWFCKREPVWTELQRKSRGIGARRESVSPGQFLSVEIPLPMLPEQRRIVARIESLAAKIEEAHSFRTQAVEEAEAILPSSIHQIFEREASSWSTLSMSRAIAMNDRQVDPKLPEYSQLPHISGENMESKTCRLLPYRTAEQDGVRSGNYLFSEGTILYSKIRPYLQKAVLVNFEGLCSADVYPIKVISSNLEPRFVMWSLVASPFTEYANRLSGRTRMPKLNRKQLFAFLFTHPPLPEQRRIVAYLDGLQAKVDALKKLQAETAAELAALLPSILDKAFKGEL